MITIEKLKELGFEDVSQDKNGLAYRKRLNVNLEICHYIKEPFLRLQTVSSGFTYPIPISTEEEIKQLCYLLTGKKKLLTGV